MKATERSEASYNHNQIEKHWQKVWGEQKLYSPNLDLPAGKAGTSKKPFGKTQGKPFYNLMMFPYPSAEGLHVGNMYAFTGADIYGRFKRMQGYDVFEPIGLDGFGIHSENYALKVSRHPKEQVKISEKNFYRQLRSTGNAYDWTRTVQTYDPEYYRWTQWIFIQMFKHGLAVRKSASVNFCPSCRTVLADEQVIDGKCERCSSLVEKKELEQWFFKITAYADRLLNSLIQIDWSEKIKIAQRQWIGKSEGLLFTAPVKDSKLTIQTFSAHFQAFCADTFVVIAPDHPLLEQLITEVPNKREILDFCKRIVKKRQDQGHVEEKNPEGIFTGRHMVDPVGNGDLPIWVANYAIKEYGTGIVKCSAHDERDFAFAKKYGIRLKPVLFPEDPEYRKRVENLEVCYTDMENGILSEPAEFANKRAGKVTKEIVSYIVQKGLAKAMTQYRIRDWLISRQRYWGPPIPMIYCQNCADKGMSWFTTEEAQRYKESGIRNQESRKKSKAHDSLFIIHNSMRGWYPVDEKDLPVELPYIEDFKPLGTHSTGSGQAVKSPLANHEEFYRTTCSNCGAEARRETDVSDTFLDSAWYFFRYTSAEDATRPWKPERAKKWLPVDMYIGGAEHAVLHLLYARFVSMFFYDLGLSHFEEPFKKFRAHGLLISGGVKMSKSRGNVIVPDQYIQKYGADTLRCYLMFLGPFEQGGDFHDTGIEGMNRFVRRVWTLLTKSQKSKVKSQKLGQGRKRMIHKTIKKVTEDIEGLHYNTAIAALMEYYNFLSDQIDVSREEVETFLKLLAPFAPHMTEELWFRLKIYDLRHKRKNLKFSVLGLASIHLQPWPTYDPKYLVEDEVTIVVQVNGKVRDTIKSQKSKVKSQKYIEKEAREKEKIKRYLEEKNVKKVIYVPGKIINFVTE